MPITKERFVTTQEKAHLHDCNTCTYLGTVRVVNDGYDFYICMGSKGVSNAFLLARYGEPGEDRSCIRGAYSTVDENIADNLLSFAKRLYLKSVAANDEPAEPYYAEDTTYA